MTNRNLLAPVGWVCPPYCVPVLLNHPPKLVIVRLAHTIPVRHKFDRFTWRCYFAWDKQHWLVSEDGVALRSPCDITHTRTVQARRVSKYLERLERNQPTRPSTVRVHVCECVFNRSNSVTFRQTRFWSSPFPIPPAPDRRRWYTAWLYIHFFYLIVQCGAALAKETRMLHAVAMSGEGARMGWKVEVP